MEHSHNNRPRTIVKIGLLVAVIALAMVAVGFFVVQLRYVLYIGTAVGVIGAALIIIGILKAAFNDRAPTEPGDWTGGAWRH